MGVTVLRDLCAAALYFKLHAALPDFISIRGAGFAKGYAFIHG
jgi:hypothetical protein